MGVGVPKSSNHNQEVGGPNALHLSRPVIGGDVKLVPVPSLLVCFIAVVPSLSVYLNRIFWDCRLCVCVCLPVIMIRIEQY